MAELFRKWASAHKRAIKVNLSSRRRYNKQWSLDGIKDIDAALKHGVMFTAGAGTRV